MGSAARQAAVARRRPAGEPAESEGFAPLARADAEILILGSLPGQESLRHQQYYAQPRNAFWPILGTLVGAGPEIPYAARVEALLAARIAVWDVCRTAVRAGSLDAAIVRASIVVNDFAGFLGRHPALSLIAFNGATAEELYRRRVLPTLSGAALALPRQRLPSTSPAHATLGLDAKRSAWRTLLGATPARRPPASPATRTPR